MGVNNFLKPVGKAIDKNLPTIFSVCSGVSFTGACVLSLKAGTKAKDILNELPETETKKEELIVKGKALAPVLAPPAALWFTGMSFLYMSNKAYLKRLAVIGAAYAVAEKKSSDIVNKVKETFGENKAEKVETDISQDKVNANPPENITFINNDDGYLFMDGWSGRQFKSTIETVKAAVNQLNEVLLRDGYVSINDLYSFISNPDLPTLQYGDELGWNHSTDGLIEMSYDSCITPKGTPCIVLRYDVTPRFEFDHYE
mgnify:CR=1 FL=1|nr:MAG TPA: hypothetical protein [Caudoviricetes sp.]